MRQSSCYQFSCWALAILLLVAVSACEKRKTFRLQTNAVRVDSLEQIILVKDSLVKPVLYTNVSGLEYLPVPQAKAKFISAVLPSILVARYEVEESKRKVLMLKEKRRWKANDSTFYLGLKTRYKAHDIDDLVARMGTLPNSIV